jgi:hypothetical protein
MKQYISYLQISRKPIYSVMRTALHNVLTVFGITMKLIRLIKMLINEMFSRVRVSKHLSDMFRNKNSLKEKDMLYRYCFSTLLWGMPLGGFR